MGVRVIPNRTLLGQDETFAKSPAHSSYFFHDSPHFKQFKIMPFREIFLESHRKHRIWRIPGDSSQFTPSFLPSTTTAPPADYSRAMVRDAFNSEKTSSSRDDIYGPNRPSGGKNDSELTFTRKRIPTTTMKSTLPPFLFAALISASLGHRATLSLGNTLAGTAKPL